MRHFRRRLNQFAFVELPKAKYELVEFNRGRMLYALLTDRFAFDNRLRSNQRANYFFLLSRCLCMCCTQEFACTLFRSVPQVVVGMVILSQTFLAELESFGTVLDPMNASD
jgi:hypothetical protein